MSCLDCDETLTTAKTIASRNYNSTACFAVGDVCNPIADELTPSENERKYGRYGNLHIVPYMGEDSLALRLLSRLRTLSPTQSACINSIKEFALGGEMTVNRRKREGFSGLTKTAEVSPSEANAFIDFLETFASGSKLIALLSQCYDNLQENGNAWVQVVMTQTAGVRSARLIGHDQMHVRYKYSKKGESRFAWVSEEWSSTYINQYPPVLLPVYPLIGEIEAGVFTTLIHKANLTTDRNWYGVPPSMGSIYYQWLEVMRGDYTQKEYGNGFTGKHFVEFEDDFDNSDRKELADSFKSVFSRKGQASSVVLRARSTNQKPATIASFANNTDEKFQAFVSEDAESQIIKSQNWSGALIGIADPGKLGATQYLDTLYAWKYKTVVQPWQNKTLSPVNKAVALVMEWMGRQDLAAYSIGLSNPMKELLEEMKTAKQPAQPQAIVQNGGDAA